jgi:hypothetical protein
VLPDSPSYRIQWINNFKRREQNYEMHLRISVKKERLWRRGALAKGISDMHPSAYLVISLLDVVLQLSLRKEVITKVHGIIVFDDDTIVLSS